jgi:hypothetical protein
MSQYSQNPNVQQQPYAAGYGAQPPQYGPPAPPAQKPEQAPRWFMRKRVLLPAVFVVGLIFGSNMGGSETEAAASSVPAASSTTTATAQAAPTTVQAPVTQAPAPVEVPAAETGPVTTFGNGTYQIGDGSGDVKPGKYMSPSPEAGVVSMCYFDVTDDNGKILDQGVANEGPSRATLKKGLTFKSSGCEDWSIQK